LRNFTLLPLNAIRKNGRNELNFCVWSDAKLHEKASESFCFHLHHGKNQSEKAFSRQAGEKRGKEEEKKIPESLKTLGRINDSRILLFDFSLRRKKEKKKQHFFVAPCWPLSLWFQATNCQIRSFCCHHTSD
jgi:hypothetical protein